MFKNAVTMFQQNSEVTISSKDDPEAFRLMKSALWQLVKIAVWKPKTKSGAVIVRNVRTKDLSKMSIELQPLVDYQIVSGEDGRFSLFDKSKGFTPPAFENALTSVNDEPLNIEGYSVQLVEPNRIIKIMVGSMLESMGHSLGPDDDFVLVGYSRNGLV